MSKKHKKVSRLLNYIDPLLTVISSITERVSISHFASLVGIPIGIRSSVTGLKIYAIIAGIKNYKSIIKENEKKHDTLLLLAKFKLSSLKL